MESSYRLWIDEEILYRNLPLKNTFSVVKKHWESHLNFLMTFPSLVVTSNYRNGLFPYGITVDWILETSLEEDTLNLWNCTTIKIHVRQPLVATLMAPRVFFLLCVLLWNSKFLYVFFTMILCYMYFILFLYIIGFILIVIIIIWF
jgi:hypothetical protein